MTSERTADAGAEQLMAIADSALDATAILAADNARPRDRVAALEAERAELVRELHRTVTHFQTDHEQHREPCDWYQRADALLARLRREP